MPRVIRVLVHASSPVVRAGLEALLRDDGRFVVVAGARPREPRADVLLIETADAGIGSALSGLAGGDALPVVLLAGEARRSDLLHAFQAGVRAVLPPHATPREIAAAIEAAAAGLAVLSAEDLHLLAPPAGMEEPTRLQREALTPRETEVLAMLAEGLGNKEIGARLNISDNTVKFHVSSILGKLGATSRGEAVARGIRRGLVIL